MNEGKNINDDIKQNNNQNFNNNINKNVVHNLGRKAANTFIPKAGGKIYDSLSKTPARKTLEKPASNNLNNHSINRLNQLLSRRQAVSNLDNDQKRRLEKEEDRNNNPISNLNSASGPKPDKEERKKEENSQHNKISKSFSPFSGVSSMVAKGLNGALRSFGINANIKGWQLYIVLFLAIFINLILIILLVVASAMQPFIGICEVLGFCGDGGIIGAVQDTIEKTEEVGESLVNFITFNGWYTDEDSFYKKLESIEKKYSDEGLPIDMPLLVSISFYQRTDIDVEQCDLEDEDCITLEDEDYDYKDMRDALDDIAKNLVIEESGNKRVKTDDEIKEWLNTSNFIGEKFKQLDIDIPSDPDKFAEMKEEFIDDCFGRRDLYLDLFTEEQSTNMCITNVAIGDDQRKKIRLTSYQWMPNGKHNSLGGTLGLVQPYVDEGTIYFDENGYAMWKGGSISKNNKKVYGEVGKDYVIVATATDMLIGQYGYEENDKIRYFDYNDAFTLQISSDGGQNFKAYNAIVLDSCGACMDWSVTSQGVYSPNKSTNPEQALKYCEETNNMKIDLFTNYQNVKNPADIAYFIDGLNGDNCANGDFEEWKQIDKKWGSVTIGNTSETVADVGCALTSVAIQIMRSGVELTVDNFNPGVAAKKFNYTSEAAIYWQSTTNVAPNFVSAGDKIDVSGMTKQQKIDKVAELIGQGYYLIGHVNGGGHYVAITGVDSNTIYMSDPGSFNAGNDLFAKYPDDNSSTRLIDIRCYKVVQ